MITVSEVLGLVGSGQPLPQDKFGETPSATVNRVKLRESGVLRAAFRAIKAVDEVDPLAIIESEVRQLCGEHGWYPGGSILGMLLASRFTENQVPDLPSLEEDFDTLLKIYAMASKSGGLKSAAWQVPLAMFASLGEERSRTFLVWAAFCAARAELLSGAAGR